MRFFEVLLKNIAVRTEKRKQITAHVCCETKKLKKTRSKQNTKNKCGFACTAVNKPQSAIWRRMTSLGLVDYLAKTFDQL